MADEVSAQIENALNLIVNMTEQSVNMKKGAESVNFRNRKYP